MRGDGATTKVVPGAAPVVAATPSKKEMKKALKLEQAETPVRVPTPVAPAPATPATGFTAVQRKQPKQHTKQIDPKKVRPSVSPFDFLAPLALA